MSLSSRPWMECVSPCWPPLPWPSSSAAPPHAWRLPEGPPRAPGARLTMEEEKWPCARPASRGPGEGGGASRHDQPSPAHTFSHAASTLGTHILNPARS